MAVSQTIVCDEQHEQLRHGTCVAPSSELEFATVSYRAAMDRRVGLAITGYDGLWRNELYDTLYVGVDLRIAEIRWSASGQMYWFTGDRIDGDRIGDSGLSTCHKPERFKVYVTDNPELPRWSRISACWHLLQ